jgi:hypothetical protein
MNIMGAVGKKHLQYVGYNVLGSFIVLDVQTYLCSGCNSCECNNVRYTVVPPYILIHYPRFTMAKKNRKIK